MKAMIVLAGGRAKGDPGGPLQRRRRGLATADEAATLTFDELVEKPGCVPLRIVATDARSRRPVVFGDGEHAALPVVDAVVASARFPLLFRPADLAGMCLTDGGLSSNLPAFLFDDAHAATGMRVLVGLGADRSRRMVRADAARGRGAPGAAHRGGMSGPATGA
jgi:predicted acylesterase/phospholipase RssA